MKNKIILWENEYLSEAMLLEMINTELYSIVGKTVLTNDMQTDKNIFPIEMLMKRYDEWDYLIYCYPHSEMLSYFEHVLSVLGIENERCINLFYIYSMNNSQIALLSTMLSTNTDFYSINLYRFISSFSEYTTVSVEGLTFVANSKDYCIPSRMFTDREIFSKAEMLLLVDFLTKYYSDLRSSKGYFFDIGANIGTTSIYVKSKLLPLFDIIAFEPIKETFKLLKTNFVINDIEDYVLNNIALSNASSEYLMKKNDSNSGNCEITDEYTENTEIVIGTTLDDYIIENKTDISKPIVLWIDTEGFEIDVILGAKKILRSKPALFFEFNPYKYGDRIQYLVDVLSESYSKYIDCDEPDVEKEIASLCDYPRIENFLTNIFMVP